MEKRSSIILMRGNIKHTSIILFLIPVVFLSSCEFFLPFDNESSEYEEILLIGPRFDLTWEYDAHLLTFEEKSNLRFVIYYKPLEGSMWKRLAVVAWSDPIVYTVREGDIEPGKYIFAVTSRMSGYESQKHTSIDFNADPYGGWYINWIPFPYF